MAKKIHSLRMLITYLVCYISIAVLCSGAVGGILYHFSYNNIYTQLETEHEKRLQYVADTMLNQIELLLSMKMYISSHQEFMPSYLNKGNYFEAKMLESLQYFRGYTTVFTNYYLYYRGSRRLYSIYNAFSLDLFLHFMALDEVPELRGAIEYGQDLVVLRNASKNEIYMVLPLNIGSAEWQGKNACLLLTTNHSTVLGFLMKMLVMESDDLSITINGQQIIGTNVPKRYSVSSSTMKYSIQVSTFSLPGEETLGTYRFDAFLVIICIACFGALFAGYLAIRNYQPIRRLLLRTEKYTISGDNEMDRINKLIDAMDKEIESVPKLTQTYTEQMKKVTGMLRKQTLFSLLNSDGSDNSAEYSSEVNDLFPYQYFQVVSMQFSQKDTGDIAELMNNFSEEGYLCYALDMPYQVDIIINSISLQRLREAGKIMQELVGDSFTEPVIAYEGIPCQGAGELPLSRLLARTQHTPDSSDENKLSFMLHDKYIESLLHTIRAGDFSSAEDRLQHLDKILTEDANEDVSLLSIQYLWMDILSRVIHLASEKQIQLPETLAGKAMLSIKSNQAMENVMHVVEYICDQISGDSMEYDESMAKSVQNYVDQHWMESQFTIDQVADELKIPARMVGHLIRWQSGISYKEYIINLRINTAKDALIHTNRSIAEICEQVGYASLPHFIRMFKQSTSYSPGEYRRIMRREKTEDA